MNTKKGATSATNAMSTRFRRPIGREPLAFLGVLALALTVPARAGTQATAIPFSDIGAKSTANYQGDALGVTATADGARLHCGFQKLEGHATPEGLWLESNQPGAAGRLRITATTLGRAGLSTINPQLSTALATTGKVSVDDKLVRLTRPGLTEEYSVSVDGVQQDFVIAAPPASAGNLRVELALSGARAEAAAGGARLRLDGSGRALAYSRLQVEDAAGRELTARLEVLSTDRLAVNVADGNATYPVRIDPTFSDADWVSLGSGIDVRGGVSALAVSGTNLYVGGGFTTAGGVPASNIAKWDGATWSALGSGMNNEVLALAEIGTNLYAGGRFTTAGGLRVNYIAKWDGMAWSALGSGISSSFAYGGPEIYALAVSGTNLYVGGWFTNAGGVPARSIAKWDGHAWSALGSGVNGGVRALAVSGTDLYAGGGFTSAGDVPATNIAKWNGSAWSPLSSGMNSTVWALAVRGTDLYAGGFFTKAGGVPATNIAKWNGGTWSSLGSLDSRYHMIPGVCALAVGGANLYAGGWFTNVGGVPANNIAKWNGSAWSALGSGADDVVTALAVDGMDHLLIGGNFMVAGTNLSSHIAMANMGSAPTILRPPLTQTAEAGATAELVVDAAGEPAPVYQWYLNGTNLLTRAESDLVLTNLLISQAGTYTVVVTNLFGGATSAPAIVNVIAAVKRRPVPGVKVAGQAGSLLNVRSADSLSSASDWSPLGSINLIGTPQYYFDLSEPLPSQRFYRAWQTGTPGVIPSLDLHMVPAITVTGNLGDSVRLDYINQFGPIDAWGTLETMTLTNTSQLYFDVSAPGQTQRLYRLVPLP